MKNTLTINKQIFPKILVIIFVGFITVYTVVDYFISRRMLHDIEDTIYHFAPMIIILILIKIGWKREKFEGIALMAISFLILGIYRFYLSMILFLFLLTTGVLLIIDDYRLHHLKKPDIAIH